MAMRKRAGRIIASVLSVALAGALGTSTALAEAVGTTTAYQTNITRNGGGLLNVGAPVFMGDNLKSNNTGLGMIVFQDESSAKIGPNSALTIDEFVYNPGGGGGQMTIGMQSGLARFYGGQLSKTGDMNVSTPHMVLGARGGIIEIFVEAGRSFARLVAGSMTCTVNGVTQVVTNPGFACTSENGELSIGYGGIDPFPILDSLDEIAGTGVPGAPGGGLDVDAACANALGNGASSCKSTDGSIPGVVIEFPDGPRGGNPPVGSGIMDGGSDGYGSCGYGYTSC